MKLNKRKQAITSASFIFGLLFSGVGFCAQGDVESISIRCEWVNHTLSKMVQEQGRTPCAVDVKHSAQLMHGAVDLITSEHYQAALELLIRAEHTLRIVHSKAEECAYFSPQVRPFINEVSLLTHELEAVLTNETHH